MTNNEIFFWGIAVPFMVFMNALGLAGAIAIIKEACMYRQLEYYKEALKAKEQECEELKKQYNCYACDTCKGKEDYINLKRHCENAIKSLHNKQAEFDQLKQTLAEIKEIVTNFYKTGFVRTDDDCILINNHLCVETLDKILQKISEVENG